MCSDKLFYTLAKPFRGDPTVRLEFEDTSGAIVTQMWNLTLPHGHTANKIKYDCQFRVVTSERPRRGIYTIITRLKFRRDPVSKECIDYIQFSSGNRSPSERICTDISPDRLHTRSGSPPCFSSENVVKRKRSFPHDLRPIRKC